VSDPDDKNNERFLFFFKNDPVSTDPQTIERFVRPAYFFDVVLESHRIPGQNDELFLDDQPKRAVDSFEIVQGFS
jgi:hypothetical protein